MHENIAHTVIVRVLYTDASINFKPTKYLCDRRAYIPQLKYNIFLLNIICFITPSPLQSLQSQQKGKRVVDGNQMEYM